MMMPWLRKTVLKKLLLAVAAMIEARTPHTAILATKLPLEVEREDMRPQWLRRLLSTGQLRSDRELEPFARDALRMASSGGQTVVIAMDQTDLSDRFAIIMVSVRIGERALPLAWWLEEGAANLGFEPQRQLLDKIREWLPTGTPVLLSADRFYGTVELLRYVRRVKWPYRIRLKSHFSVDTGQGELTTTGELAAGCRERYLPQVTLFAEGVPTAIGILQEPGHPEPWIIAMDCPPTRARVLDYGLRWGIEPMFSDLKSRGFEWAESHLEQAKRLDQMILIMALALHWCVRVGWNDPLELPTPLEKKAQEQTSDDHWNVRKMLRSRLSWFTRGLRKLYRLVENGLPLPPFWVPT
ncbi:transposase [Candidatus Accumulibacter phosphatis]|nr:transposase [Candidatus Accumulibacter phosphatis]